MGDFEDISDAGTELEILIRKMETTDPGALYPMAEQFFLLAMADLRKAASNIQLADYHEMQGR